MDVQGAEWMVIKGMNKIKPKMIFAEVSEGYSYHRSLIREDFNALLEKWGYELVRELNYDNLYVLNEIYLKYNRKRIRGYYFIIIELIQLILKLLYRMTHRVVIHLITRYYKIKVKRKVFNRNSDAI